MIKKLGALVTLAMVTMLSPALADGVRSTNCLVIRGMIESPLTEESLRGMPQDASMAEADVMAAIDLVIQQGDGRAWTHELILTPPAARWQG